jgi:SAM-dependent methyltransferase
VTLSLREWERIYREEPDLYERLIAGESIHPEVLAALPDASEVVELGAGTGRLTGYLSARYDHVVAVEPSAAFRERLASRGFVNVEVVEGRFDAIPAPDKSADLVVSCSAFTAHPRHGGDASLREMERVARDVIAFVWPADVDWLCARGFSYHACDGDMTHDFPSLDEAIELASMFYPDAVDEIRRRGCASVPYEVLGMNAPRDIAWKALR